MKITFELDTEKDSKKIAQILAEESDYVISESRMQKINDLMQNLEKLVRRDSISSTDFYQTSQSFYEIKELINKINKGK